MNAPINKTSLAIWLCGLVLTQTTSMASAQTPQVRAALGAPVEHSDAIALIAGGSQTLPTTNVPITDMAWQRDPIFATPNFFGDFYARGTPAQRIPGDTTLTFMGKANDSGGNVTFFAPFTSGGVAGLSGPGGPYNITSNVTGTFTVFPVAALNENAQLTGLVQAKFPGATFANGTGSVNGATVLFNYLVSLGILTPDAFAVVNLSNPSGGGLVGRNNYFDNGSPVPHDRVYYFYNHIATYQGLGAPFDINRHVFGIEKTFGDGWFSVEVRVPFAGTADSDQAAGQALSVNHTEFGNLGLVFKGVLYRSPTLLVSLGLGLSLPTADTSRLIVNGQSAVEIENRAVLLQPLLGVAWAPNDRVYAQFGVQFDVDPSGNPVQTLDPAGNYYRAGKLRDQCYSFVSGAAGWWAYRNDVGILTGLALQGELHYDTAFGPHHFVQDGNVLVTDGSGHTNVLNGTAGVVATFNNRAALSLGISFPIAGGRLYDWNLIAQMNYRFGPQIP